MTWITELTDGTLTQTFDKPGTTANRDVGKRFAQTPRMLAFQDGESWDWTKNAIITDVTVVQTQLVTAAKAENERRVMLIYSPMRGKMKKYARKQQEVLDWYGLAPAGAVATVLNTAFGALSALNRKKKFRFAQADAARRGDTVADAIARFETGITGSEDAVADLEAVEQAAVAAIKAATTVTAARATFAAINWDWRSS